MADSTDPAPRYDRVKDLHLATPLVRRGRAAATIVTPANGSCDDQALRIQEAVWVLTGVSLPVADDTSPEVRAPWTGHVIALGNRSTNASISELYERHFCLLDLRYPGPGGHVLRSLHNPFGNGSNALLVGGSDAAGVTAAAEALVSRLQQAASDERELALGWLLDVRLGRGMKLPADVRDFEIWEASAGYGSVGYFGWNSISKRMAAYYMTGDEHHAREFLRLAFPDDRAKAEISAIDGERIENKDEPLAGPYHYNAHMMILYWDLIEESPVFTDEERLRVTNAFARQFFHAEDQGWRRQILEGSRQGPPAYDEPPPHVGSRHGQWSAISLYCLCRYFHRDYPDPLWEHGMAAARWHFASLKEHAWVGGENDNLYWYCTGIAPILSYLLLTGEREPLENGVVSTLLRGLDMLVSGREPDWALNSASMGFLHKAAYLSGDGRFLEYARRTGVDRQMLRLGQAYWPEPGLEPRAPEDQTGQWHVQQMPEPMWRKRRGDLPLDESFLFASWRTAADSRGDYLLIKGMNGESRNPYHTFAVLEARLDGDTVLAGFLNQVRVRVDGAVEPRVAMDAALRHRATVGTVAAARAETPEAPFSRWERTLLQRQARCLVIADRLTFRETQGEAEVEVWWEGGDVWQTPATPGQLESGGSCRGQVRLCDGLPTEVHGKRSRMVWRGPAAAQVELVFLSLVASGVGDDLSCRRLGPRSAALRLPEAGVAVCGEEHGMAGDLVVVTADRVWGTGVRRVALDSSGAAAPLRLLEADGPLDVDWDLASGTLQLSAGQPVRLRLEGETARDLPAGRHVLTTGAHGSTLAEWVTALAARAEAPFPVPPAGAPHLHGDLPALAIRYAADVGGEIAALETIHASAGTWLAAASGDAIHLLDGQGATARVLRTDGPIRVLRWWREAGLLLAGCTDEQVVAFDPETGERAWVFTSQMDAAVWRAAKTYWFKSQPGHEGIHGLHTGAFLDRSGAGGTQAFAGSACTLEILDEGGGLLERLPVFWGPGTQFRIIDGPEGRPRLLVAREPTDSHALAIIDPRELDGRPRGYHGVPEGHSSIGGWACMSRDHICCADVDGDGEPEVVSEINGTWNRITVWAADGTPKYNLQLGPGDAIPARNVRDLDLVDVDGDGLPEIVAALSSGLVLCLNGHCEPLWTRRLDSPPSVLAAVGGDGHVLVGCDDGSVVRLDGGGSPVGRQHTEGRARRVASVPGAVVFASDTGHVLAIESP